MRILVSLFSLLFSMTLWAQAAPEKYKEGVHYQKIPSPLRTISGDKVEVAEIFWYGCGHCYSFEPSIKKWEENKPAEVNLVKVPGSWKKEHAKVYYVAEMLGIVDTAHGKVFDVMHNDPKFRPHQMLTKEKDIKNFFVGLGVSEEKFEKEYNGGSVKMALNFADSNIRSLSKQMGAVGVKVSTPSMVVAGKYYVTMNSDVPRFSHMLDVTDFLVAKEIAAKKK